MEKLSFWASVKKSFSLYFKYFGKIFLPFLWPFLWMLGGWLIMTVGFIATGALSPVSNIAAIVVVLISLVLGLAIFIKACVRFIMLSPATSIVTKKLLFNGEIPDYKEALQEIRNDSGKLAKLVLWLILYMLAIVIISVLFFRIITSAILTDPSEITTKGKIISLIWDVLLNFVYVFALFIYQFFAFRKDLCARECMVESFKLAGKYYIPIVSVMIAWNLICYLIGLVQVLAFLMIPVIFIIMPVFLILTTYWYLRFTEENKSESEKGE